MAKDHIYIRSNKLLLFDFRGGLSKMKKNLFAFFLGTVVIFLILPRLYSEENGETDVLKFTYHFEEPRTFSSGEYAGISIAGLKQYRDVGKPILPCKTVKILLPHGRTYSGVTVKAGEMKSIEGSYLIAPGQSPYISQTEPIPPDPEVYSSAGPYPAEVFKVVTLQNKKGYRILYVNLFPVKYIPSRRKLSWYSEI